MAVAYKHEDYTTSKQILAFPEPYVAVAHTFKKDDSASVTIDGKKILRAGTIYPSNDASAIGIVFNDYDVTDGDVSGALLLFGFVKLSAIPTAPTTNAKTALNMIKFLPINTTITTTVTANGAITKKVADITSGDTMNVELVLSGDRLKVEQGSLVSNWTITGESTTGLTVEKITVSEDGMKAVITLKAGTAGAGSVTIIPKAGAMALGNVPSSATTIVTVSAS